MPARPSHPLKATCLILAGGKGRRLSPDKPLLEIHNRPIIERAAGVAASLFEEVLVVTNTPEKYRFLGLPLVPDERRGCGPLMGIYSGLRRIAGDTAFVCAADMPFLDPAIIRSQFLELGEFDIVVPCPWSRPEFLHAFYRKRCLPAIRDGLEADRFRIEMLEKRCRTLRLERDWFESKGLTGRMALAFTNINTWEDLRRCRRQPPPPPSCPDPLASLAPGVLRQVRRTLIEQETAYQRKPPEEGFSSLWSHSHRVARIAHRIAMAEGWEAEPALLAGLFHDMGKFAKGGYHEDDTPEEREAVRFAERILSGTVYRKWVPEIRQAILSAFLEGEPACDTGRALYDADSIDKLGNMGIAQFFGKRSLRRQFLADDLLIRAGVELTYAHHAPETLKTETGRALAGKRGRRTRRFYEELLEEWRELGLGAFDILEEDIAGIVCVLVVPTACGCGGRLEISSDIRDSLKCRSAVVTYRCRDCAFGTEYAFCLPNVRGLPVKR